MKQAEDLEVLVEKIFQDKEILRIDNDFKDSEE